MLNLFDPNVKKVRATHEALVGKRVKARGTYCAVFDNGDSVLKLTTCRASYYMVTDGVAACSGPNFPKLVNDYGEVADDLFLYEVEKLKPARSNSEVCSLARKLAKRWEQSCYAKSFFFRDCKSVVNESNLPIERKQNLIDSFDEMERFVGVFGFDEVSPDICERTIMTRPATGEFVWSDPFFLDY